MKTLISILTLAVCNLFFYPSLHAQDNETGYVVISYMKVKPGMHDKYLECEQAWKLIHQQGVKAGKITGWSLQQVVYPSGTNSEYDYVTITNYKNWESMNTQTRMPLDEVFAALPEGKRAAAENFAEYRDMVKSEIWTTGDMAFAPGDSRAEYAVVNYMKIPANGWEDWVEMETQFVKPVHEKNIAMGNRAGWLIASMVLPRGDGYPYQVAAVDFYNTWEDMNKDEGKAWEALYPDMNQSSIGNRITATRTLAKTEVRKLVDYIR